MENNNRPWDWQDRVVVTASVITSVICLLLMVWGK